jgi:hypothetical protein
VIIAHQFTPEQMIPEDYHSISHHWAHLASERGVRLFIVNFFRVVHATEPLECLRYLEHIRGAVEGEGFRVVVTANGRGQTGAAGDQGSLGEMGDSGDSAVPDAHSTMTDPTPASVHLRHFRSGAIPEFGLRSPEVLIPAAAGALAVGEIFDLPDAATLALASIGAAGTLLGNERLDRARNALERQYAPAYASKSIALGTAALAPLAAAAIAQSSDSVLETLLADGVIAAASAASLAALTSSDEYRLRIEEYKGFDLELWMPIVGMLILQPMPPQRKLAGVALAAAGWYATRRLMPDPLARFDAAPALSHTHHLSAAMRVVGDVLLAAGPRPVRKWAALAPLGLAVSMAARERGNTPLATGALIVSAVGHAASNTGFRRPERDPALTAQMAATSWGAGALAGLILAKIISSFGKRWIL